MAPTGTDESRSDLVRAIAKAGREARALLRERLTDATHIRQWLPANLPTVPQVRHALAQLFNLYAGLYDLPAHAIDLGLQPFFTLHHVDPQTGEKPDQYYGQTHPHGHGAMISPLMLFQVVIHSLTRPAHVTEEQERARDHRQGKTRWGDGRRREPYNLASQSFIMMHHGMILMSNSCNGSIKAHLLRNSDLPNHINPTSSGAT